MTYDPSVLHAERGDRIIWRSTAGEFTLVFPERTPFSNALSEICSREERSRGQVQQVGRATVARRARGASYRYQVAVHVPNKGVFIDPGCGEVIIK
jgi:hypothetical protein